MKRKKYWKRREYGKYKEDWERKEEEWKRKEEYGTGTALQFQGAKVHISF